MTNVGRRKNFKPPEAKGLLSTSDMLREWHFTHRSEFMKLVDRGMPHKKIDERYYFDLEECERWYRQYAW